MVSEEIVNWKDISESLELILTDYKPRLTDHQIDRIIEMLDEALANNSDSLVLKEDIE